jgi:hypothetical protein
MIKYHKRTLELLGIISENLETEMPLINWAKKNDVVLPESYLEWAKIDLSDILTKYSNQDNFYIHKPSIKNIAGGRRGILFCRENQGNFDLIVMLDEGDDPPVLMSFGGEDERWFQYSKSFSDAIFCQIFDWQYALDFSGDWPEIAYSSDFIVQPNHGIAKFIPQCQGLPQTQIVYESTRSIEHRLSLQNGIRVIITEYNEAAQITIYGLSIDLIDRTEDELILHFNGDVAPPSYTCILFALLELNRHLCNKRSNIKLSSLFMDRQSLKEAILKRLQLCVGERAIEKLRTSEWDNLSDEPIFTLYVPTADAYIHLVSEGLTNWRLYSISQDKNINIQ